ncbi:MAG: AbrB/MazE/SpoVT family DNA-binding domain-containing protein [Gammaproteobacteria bacterium]|nr:AbrB/MazE/SpoVT family DNA-binding domain-containing protein [Gammaproteobacteria bacterium]
MVDSDAHGRSSHRVRIDGAGRVVIPVDIREALGIEKGQELTLSLTEDGLTLCTLELARARVKALARAHRKDDGSVVDAFLTARRAEAAGEP